MVKINLALPRKRLSTPQTPVTPIQTRKKGNSKTSPKKSTKKGGDGSPEKIEHGYYAPGMHPTNGKKQQPKATVDEKVDYGKRPDRLTTLHVISNPTCEQMPRNCTSTTLRRRPYST